MRARCGSPIVAGGDRVAHRWWAGSKRRLKPIWNGTPAAVDGGERAIDLGEVERDRLLAEDRLAGARRRRRSASACVAVLEQIATASTSARRSSSSALAGDRHAELGADGARGRGRGVVDRASAAPGHLAREQLGVHAADPPDADHADPQRRVAAPGAGSGAAQRPCISPPAARRRLPTGPTRAERSSAACTETQSTASSKPGVNGRPSATARQNS